MREGGIRDVFFSGLVDSKYQLQDTSDYLPQSINKALRSHWSANVPVQTASAEGNDLAALDETFQEKTEVYLNQELDQHSAAWSNRKNVRGEFFNWLYKLRNTVFGINANTTRKMIPQRYQTNMHALEEIVKDCIDNDRKVLVYIPPIRYDVAIPYDQEEYKIFKEQIRAFSQKYPQQVFFRNLEAIVPGQLWGYKAATNLKAEKEIDFMHFQFKGHEILADSLEQSLKQMN
jgi:hypothetical protein